MNRRWGRGPGGWAAKHNNSSDEQPPRRASPALRNPVRPLSAGPAASPTLCHEDTMPATASHPDGAHLRQGKRPPRKPHPGPTSPSPGCPRALPRPGEHRQHPGTGAHGEGKRASQPSQDPQQPARTGGAQFRREGEHRHVREERLTRTGSQENSNVQAPPRVENGKTPRKGRDGT